MALSKGYGPTGLSYYQTVDAFINDARDKRCELFTIGGNTIPVDLSKCTDSELRELYTNATGVCFSELIQLKSV